MIRSGRPTASAMVLITPAGTEAMYDVKMWSANSSRCTGRRCSKRSHSWRSDIAVRSGRRARSSIVRVR